MIWQPVPGNIITRWAKELSPTNAWQEYPRPQMRRPDWVNLNGLWDYWIIDRNDTTKRIQEGQILVPFAIESSLSGVKRALLPTEQLWYRRSFSIPQAWYGKRVVLHFEAVDWKSTVFVNGKAVGEHSGGFLPFSYDITEHLADGEAPNELLVSVWDPTDTHWQSRGKQVLQPKACWYSAVSGIWQTVWLEPVPATYISGLKITPDIDAGIVRVKVDMTGPEKGLCRVNLKVKEAGEKVAEGKTDTDVAEITIQIPHPKLWNPGSPHLYDLEITAGEDRVSSYFGMRKFSLEDGHLCINNVPLFQLGPLDQGYWPDGLYTPPSDEAMRWDIELVKRLGFNMLRKHVKVEPRRFYYYCDRIGLIVWQDMPNGGKAVGDIGSTVAMVFNPRRRDNNYHSAGREEAASRQDFLNELKEMVDHLYNCACIGVWVPFNEGWGQFDAKETARWLKNYDPTRLVDHASGWYDQGAGDCLSEHRYVLKLRKIKPEQSRAAVISEFGGYLLKLEGHQWNPGKQFGYKDVDSTQALTKAYLQLLKQQVKPCLDAGLSAAIYTQLTDVEIEMNGYVTYDRAEEKMDFDSITQAHKELIGQ